MKSKALILLVTLIIAAVPAFAGPGCGKDHDKVAKAGHSCANDGEHANHVCPMKDKNVTETTDVTLTGEVLCRHCDLHETESCEKVFKASNETVYPICPSSDLGDHGKGEVTVTGKVMKADDGSTLLMIESIGQPSA